MADIQEGENPRIIEFEPMPETTPAPAPSETPAAPKPEPVPA